MCSTKSGERVPDTITDYRFKEDGKIIMGDEDPVPFAKDYSIHHND